jgi:hypothetical protein
MELNWKKIKSFFALTCLHIGLGVHFSHIKYCWNSVNSTCTPCTAESYFQIWVNSTNTISENVWCKLNFLTANKVFLQPPGYSEDYGLDDRGALSSSPGNVKNFLFCMSSRPAVGPIRPPIQWIPEALSLEVKRPRLEADYSPPVSAEVKEMWIYTSTLPWRSV